MTEKEKMENGKMYDANYDKELEQERLECKTLCQEYNHLPIKDMERRRADTYRTGFLVRLRTIYYSGRKFLCKSRPSHFRCGRRSFRR